MAPSRKSVTQLQSPRPPIWKERQNYQSNWPCKPSVQPIRCLHL